MTATSSRELPERYAQDTEFVLLDILMEALQEKTFIDIGAEKGAFAHFFMQKGLQGTLFEPFPRHHTALQELTAGTASRFFPYAIDREDRTATLHLSYDDEGVLHDHFHSLIPLHDDARVHHQDALPVQCRSLESLLQEGLLDTRVGILKIDTEGNDLNVLRGMGGLRAEVLLCEFFTEGLYAGWEEAYPEGLIAEAERLGYRHYLAIKKYRGHEVLSWSPAVFASEEWGNLLFLEEAIYGRCQEALESVIAASDALSYPTCAQPPVQAASATAERPATLQGWLARQMARCVPSVAASLLIDVGAYRGDFTQTLLEAISFAHAFLFEPHPANIANLEPVVAEDDRMTLVPLALGKATGEVCFHATQDRATGSVLPYAPAALGLQDTPASFPVQQTTLDRYLDSQAAQARVGLIKIDAQGSDLDVLKGAEQTLRQSRPWLVVELIFGPLYEGQASPETVFNWLYAHGYRLAAFFNEHEAEEGWLAFADAVFVPAEVDRHYEAPYHAKPAWDKLQAQVHALQAICEERLDLINHLHEEAERRLVIIQQLEKELRKNDTN